MICAPRNPEHRQRPSFEEICNYLQQPIDALNHDDDGISATEIVDILGAELEAATHLYMDLQETYYTMSPELNSVN